MQSLGCNSNDINVYKSYRANGYSDHQFSDGVQGGSIQISIPAGEW